MKGFSRVPAATGPIRLKNPNNVHEIIAKAQKKRRNLRCFSPETTARTYNSPNSMAR